ncbi:hypothetical protein RHECNPAF_122100185 [Rhizobium etli CNPAF512]|nr:hypothetical protein RHECNPAF_122100185 [Rhizobium etli CNPAF512]
MCIAGGRSAPISCRSMHCEINLVTKLMNGTGVDITGKALISVPMSSANLNAPERKLDADHASNCHGSERF